MTQAVKLTPETVMLCAIKTDQPAADIRALYEHYRDSGVPQYIVFDYDVPGGYAPWLPMSEEHFQKTFRFVFGENPNKFEPVVCIR